MHKALHTLTKEVGCKGKSADGSSPPGEASLHWQWVQIEIHAIPIGETKDKPMKDKYELVWREQEAESRMVTTTYPNMMSQPTKSIFVWFEA